MISSVLTLTMLDVHFLQMLNIFGKMIMQQRSWVEKSSFTTYLIAGAFVHTKHHQSLPPHLQGWWSNAQETRFEMRDRVDPAPGAESFRLCNPPPWLAALNLASLEIFEEAGMEALLKKQITLTGYLEHLLLNRFLYNININ